MNDKELWASIAAFGAWFQENRKRLDYSDIHGMLNESWRAGVLFGMALERSSELGTSIESMYENLPERKEAGEVPPDILLSPEEWRRAIEIIRGPAAKSEAMEKAKKRRKQEKGQDI